MSILDVEEAVRERYVKGAREKAQDLCCPTTYDSRYLAILPREVIERDYGCGDPSAHLAEGETVLDLGSGSGKVCYIAAQIVGPRGHVIGVDMNEEMLALARRYQPEIARRLGYDNVRFVRAKIQDLRTDLDEAERYLRGHPISSLAELRHFEACLAQQRACRPLIPDECVDVVVSNCVLNLVRDDEKRALFAEIYRVLRRGGRAVISDIVADEPVPEHLKADPELWSGCISGAFQEAAFLDAFAAAGFYGIEILDRADKPWRVVEGIEFRAVTVRAWKGKEGPCWDCNQAVIYRGPWSEVRDDDGHALRRGVPAAVCEKTFRIYTRGPYARDIIPVEPRIPVHPETAKPFDCGRDRIRHPRETKGMDYRETTETAAPCCSGGKCP